MKEIKGINDKLDLFTLTDEGEKKDKSSFKDMYRTIVSLSLGKSGEQALEMFELGLKIKNLVGDVLPLEDAEYRLLKSKVEDNVTQLAAYFQAQLLHKLKQADDTATKG